MIRSAKEFTRTEVRRIAVNFATTPDDFDAVYLASLYHTTREGIHSILRRAVVESIVSPNIVKSIVCKSGRNSARHGHKSAKEKAMERYQNMMERRQKFQFSMDEREYYAIEYANCGAEVTPEIFAEMYCMTVPLLNRTLKSAIVDNIVSDEVVDKLYTKALEHSSKPSVDKYFETLREERQIKKNKKRKSKKEAQPIKDIGY